MQFNSKIDLAALSQNRDRRVRPSTFKILRMTVSFFKQSPASIDFGEFTDDASHYFSLFIGRNGVGKSLLLRAVLDFLIDARGPRQTTFNMRSPVTITSIEYIIDNVLYKISKDDNKWKYYKNNAAVEKEYIVFPFIVASTMGMFDKFPLNSIQGKSKNARYISDYYKYVGPKANNNMFTSKTNVLLQIQDLGRSLLRIPATPLPGVEQTLRAIRDMGKYKMVVFTKGEILDQENKLLRSGLWPLFDRVEVVADKTPRQYRELCETFDIDITRLLMVGNSFKSDIAPVLELGGFAAHIPFEVTWQHEQTEEYDHHHLFSLNHITELLKIL